MKTIQRKILKVSLLIIAFAISIAILSACNGTESTLPSEHFEGNCITKGFTRYYKPNGTYFDREDAEFGEHSYGEGTVISVRSCTADGITKFTCELCKNERFTTVEKLGHDYKAIEGRHAEPTCTEDGYTDFVCARCNEQHTEVHKKLGHNYDEQVIKEPTCTEKGIKFLDCLRCEYNITQDIDTLPHSPSSEIFANDEGHWSICKVCDNQFYEKHTIVTNFIPSTCVSHAYTHIMCEDCNYFRDVIDENSQLLSHRYEAYTCLVCQRDRMLDYKKEFDSMGANSSNLINIDSQEKFICFYDYLIAHQITVPKYIKITYTTVKANDEEVNAFLSNVRRKITATNWGVKTMFSYNTFTNEITYLYMNATNSDNFVFDDVASYTPNDYPSEYQNLTCAQYESYQFQKNTPRSADFDDFAYKSRINEMTVSSSDQLFYAFEHGYKPIAQSGSPAQSMLEKAKIIARNIMNDEMTDLEKVRAIYSYLVSDVAYDYGIVELTKDSANNTAFAKCSSYYLEGVFNYKIAVCDGISKAFCVLAGIENIKCVRITSENHAWNKVYIDVNGDGQKAWFGTDATWANQGVYYNDERGEYLSVEDFLFTDAQKATRGQRGRNYTDTGSDATTEENPFAYFYFDEAENDSCDFVITSNTELSTLISYLKANLDNYKRGDIVTVNIFIVTTYWAESDISNNLYKELRSQWAIVGATAAITLGTNAINIGMVTGYSATIIIPKM